MKERILSAEAIIFDLDGVLVNSIAVVEKSWSIWAEEQGLSADAILKVAHGRRTAEILQTVAPHLDMNREIEHFVEIEQRLLNEVSEIPGAAEFVRSLPRDRWAIGTSGERAVALGRLRKFAFPVPDVLVASEDVENGKPNPEVYVKAAAGLGVACDRCVVFEDAPAGIAAARAAGMSAVGVLTATSASELVGVVELIQDFRNVRTELVFGVGGSHLAVRFIGS